MCSNNIIYCLHFFVASASVVIIVGCKEKSVKKKNKNLFKNIYKLTGRDVTHFLIFLRPHSLSLPASLNLL